MKNYIDFLIVKELKLIIEYYAGDIYLEDFIRTHDKKGNHSDFNANFNLMVDFRDSTIHLTQPEIIQLVDYHKNSKILYGERKAAHITKTPRQVVAGMNFDIHNKKLPISIKVFSTVGASLNWVNVKMDELITIES